LKCKAIAIKTNFILFTNVKLINKTKKNKNFYTFILTARKINLIFTSSFHVHLKKKQKLLLK